MADCPMPPSVLDGTMIMGTIDALNQARQRALDGANAWVEMFRHRAVIHFEQLSQKDALANRLLEGPPAYQAEAKKAGPP